MNPIKQKYLHAVLHNSSCGTSPPPNSSLSSSATITTQLFVSASISNPSAHVLQLPGPSPVHPLHARWQVSHLCDPGVFLQYVPSSQVVFASLHSSMSAHCFVSLSISYPSAHSLHCRSPRPVQPLQDLSQAKHELEPSLFWQYCVSLHVAAPVSHSLISTQVVTSPVTSVAS